MHNLNWNLNWIDYILLTIFGLSVLSGLFRGLFREILSVCTLIAAFIVATVFASSLATTFTSSQTVQNAVNQASSSGGVDPAQSATYVALGLSFGLLFIGTLLVGAIISFILNLIFKASVLGIGNRLLGGLFGFFRGFLINLVLIFLVQLTSFSNDAAWTDSQLVALFQPSVQWLGNLVSPTLADLKAKFNKKLEDMQTAPSDNKNKTKS